MLVAQLLAAWLLSILEGHPLCSRQITMPGHVGRCMRYQDWQYDLLQWTQDQDAVLRQTLTDEQAYSIFPSKSRGQVRRRRRYLLAYA